MVMLGALNLVSPEDPAGGHAVPRVRLHQARRAVVSVDGPANHVVT
jgi:hypothetical protein